MHNDASNILEAFFDLCFNTMGYTMSFSYWHFPIDKEMEFYKSIKSALAYQTDINMFDFCILENTISDLAFEFRITWLIKEFSHRWPSNMIDIIEHKYACNNCGIIRRLCKILSSKERKKSSEERYSCRNCIWKMMKCIACNSSTLEITTYDKCSKKESSLDWDNSNKDPECPKLWNSWFRTIDSLYCSRHNLKHCEDKKNRHSESCHWFCLAMSVGMIIVSWLLRISHTKVHNRWSNDICGWFNCISNKRVRIPKYSSKSLDNSEENIDDDSCKSYILSVLWSWSIHVDR